MYFSPLVEIREHAEFHGLVEMDKSYWPRCLLWHGWLSKLSGVNGASPWATLLSGVNGGSPGRRAKLRVLWFWVLCFPFWSSSGPS